MALLSSLDRTIARAARPRVQARSLPDWAFSFWERMGVSAAAGSVSFECLSEQRGLLGHSVAHRSIAAPALIPHSHQRRMARVHEVDDPHLGLGGMLAV